MFSQTDAEYLERLKYLETGAGKLFIVAPSSASYYSELVSQSYPGRVVQSVDRALGLCASGRGDTILLLPGAHVKSGTDDVEFDKDNVTIMGFGPESTSYTSATDCIFLKGGTGGLTVRGLTLDAQNAADGGVSIQTTASSLDGVLIEDCWFQSAGTAGLGVQIEGTGAYVASNIMVRRCRFIDNATGVDIITSGTATFSGLTIEDCDFLGCAKGIADDGSTGAAGDGLLIKGCRFNGNTAIFDFDAFANTGMVTNCYFDNLVKATKTQFGDLNVTNIKWVANYSIDGLSVAPPS